MKNFKNSLIALTWPIFIELFLQMLVGNIDQMMMSQVSQTGVAAIGNCNQILNILIITFSVISLAMTILVTQSIGADNKENVSKLYTLSLIVNAIFGAIVAIILIGGNTIIFHMMRVPAEVLEECRIYITIIGYGIIFQSLYMTYVSMFRTQGYMKETMIISSVMNIINIIGNFILIPRLGIAGAALSSTVSRFIGLLILIVMFQRINAYPMSLKAMQPFPFNHLNKMLQIGVPSAGEGISYSASQIVITTLVNTFGTSIINVRVYSNMFASLSYLMGSAVSQAAQILVGYDIGSKEYDRADKQVKKTLGLSLIFSETISILLFIFAEPLFSLFTSDPVVITLGKQVLFVEIFLEAGRAVNMTMVRSLQACGDITFPVTLGIFSQWVVSVGLSYLFGIAMNLGVVGVWIAMACDEVFRGILFIIRWQSGKWKTYELLK